MFRWTAIAILSLVACGDSSTPNVVGQTSNNSVNNTTNNSTNNSTNNATNGSTNNATNNTTNNAVVVQKCSDYCNLMFGSCVESSCTLDTATESSRAALFDKCSGTGLDSCIARYNADSTFQNTVDTAPTGDCSASDIQSAHCKAFGFEACGCPIPEYPKTCTVNEDCNGGTFDAECRGEAGAQYCYIPGCFRGEPAPEVATKSDMTGCGVDNLCVDDVGGGTTCFKGCASAAECHEGDICLLGFDFDGPYGVCQPPCTIEFCRDVGQVCANDGICSASCTLDEECGGGRCEGKNSEGELYCIF